MQSLFQVTSQQVAADLDSFDFSSTTENQNIPFITNSCFLPEVVESSVPVFKQNTWAKKRDASEISEDEEYSSSSFHSDGSVGSSPDNPRSPAKKISGRRALTGYASSSISDFLNRQSMKNRPTADTSTEHIQALTSSKGPSMCFDIVNAMKDSEVGSNQELSPVVNNVYDMTPEEKKVVHRARNRWHARNTRVRKQAHVEELKRTLCQMLQERDGKKEVLAEERRIRCGVVAEFLRLQTIKEPSADRWNAILEERVTLDISQTRYSGADEIMVENKTNQMFGDGSFSCKCLPSTFLMEGVNVVVDWTVMSADQQKANRGTCRASFDPQSNKLSSVAIYRTS